MEIRKDDSKTIINALAFIKTKCAVKCTGEELFAIHGIIERCLEISDNLKNEFNYREQEAARAAKELEEKRQAEDAIAKQAVKKNPKEKA